MAVKNKSLKKLFISLTIFAILLTGYRYSIVGTLSANDREAVRRLQNSGWGGTFEYAKIRTGSKRFDDSLNSFFYSNKHGRKFLRVIKININVKAFNDQSLKEVRHFKSLKSLSITNSQITDLTPLEGLTQLNWLFLDESNVSNLETLSKLENLQYIKISISKITDISPLNNLRSLKTLVLDGNKIESLPSLQELKNLKRLSLDGNQITDIKPLAALSNLNHLDLQSNEINDLTPLAALKNLKDLWLGSNPDVTKAEVEKLQKILPNCEISFDAAE